MTSHDHEDGDQGSDGLLSDDILGVSQFTYESGNVFAQTLTSKVHARLFILVEIILHVLWHAYEKIDDAQCHQHNLEVRIVQK